MGCHVWDGNFVTRVDRHDRLDLVDDEHASLSHPRPTDRTSHLGPPRRLDSDRPRLDGCPAYREGYAVTGQGNWTVSDRLRFSLYSLSVVQFVYRRYAHAEYLLCKAG